MKEESKDKMIDTGGDEESKEQKKEEDENDIKEVDYEARYARYKRSRERMLATEGVIRIHRIHLHAELGDPSRSMNCFVKPNFPGKIQARLKSLPEDLQKDLREVFNEEAGSFELGDMLFD